MMPRVGESAGQASGSAATATITYTWDHLGSTRAIAAGGQTAPAIASLAKGGYFATWDEPTGASVEGVLLEAPGPAHRAFLVNSTTTGIQADSSVAGLLNGRSVVSFTDYSEGSDGDVRARMFKKNGSPVDLDFGVAVGGLVDTDSDVAALAGGGFAIAWTRDISDNTDLRVSIFRANGSIRASSVPIDTGGPQTSRASVAGLADGSFVVAFQQSTAEGGDSSVHFKRFEANGSPRDATPVVIDDIGTINEDIQVVGLEDGGFAVAYTDNGWIGDGGAGTDITFAIFDADGAERTGYRLVNTSVAGDQNRPTVTVMANGYVLVGWSDEALFYYQAYDPDGSAIGDNDVAADQAIEGEIAGLNGGFVGSVREAIGDDADGTSIRNSRDELLRTITGDATNETLSGDGLRDTLLGEGGKDKLFGFNGKDTLDGGDGDDVLRGGNDSDVLTGGAGADRFAYSDVIQSFPLGWLGDTIRDFSASSDLIDVEAIDADTETDGDQAFVYIGDAAFSAPGQIRAFYTFRSGVTVQFSTDTDSAPEMELLLKNMDTTGFNGADFVL